MVLPLPAWPPQAKRLVPTRTPMAFRQKRSEGDGGEAWVDTARILHKRMGHRHTVSTEAMQRTTYASLAVAPKLPTRIYLIGSEPASIQSAPGCVNR